MGKWRRERSQEKRRPGKEGTEKQDADSVLILTYLGRVSISRKRRRSEEEEKGVETGFPSYILRLNQSFRQKMRRDRHEL